MLTRHIATAGLLLTLLAEISSAAISVQRRGEGLVRAYDRVELEVRLERQYENPFDPGQIAVDAKVTSPDGTKVVVPGFWGRDFPNTFQDPLGIKARAMGEASFRVRICPTRAGRWTIVVVAKDQHGTVQSDPMAIDVASSANPGFVRVSPANQQYLKFDGGGAYFPVGMNIAWADGEHEKDYLEWFSKLHEAGGNFARVWLCHPPVRIENEHAGLGRYDLRNASYFDDLLDLAQQKGIFLMLTMNNHRELLERDRWGSGHWGANPYNAINGGPAKLPIDFFTNPTARQYHQRRLRYLVARYASYTSLACWELFNEQENTQLKEIPDDWNEQMASYLKHADPYDHLVSTSATLPESIWQMPAMSITQSHVYGDGDTADLVMPVADAARRLAKLNKPHLIAETGISFMESDATFDAHTRATAMHNSLWASVMSGACGAAAYWWWHDYVDPKNLWHELTPIAKFASTIDWPRRHFKPLLLPAPRWATNAPEKLSDLVINSSGGGAWGRAGDAPIVILPSGQISGALPYYLYGPAKEELQTRTTLIVDLPRDGPMTLHIAKVSDLATLRIFVDGIVTKVFQYDASPGMPDQESTATIPQDPNVYQAIVDQDRVVELNAGKHTIALDVSAGDWIGIDRITFAHAKSSFSADLMTVALQDESAGETIAWLYDATSNWLADQAQSSGRAIENVTMAVPISRPGSYDVQWWDTRTGAVIRIDAMALTDGALLLRPPAFRRDIALRVIPAADRN